MTGIDLSKIMKKFIIGALAFAPTLAFAQSLNNIQTLLTSIQRLISLAMPIVVGLALLGFFWGLAKFIFAAGDEGKKDEGKRLMIWGVVAFFVMISVWGLAKFIGSALGVQEGGTANIPEVPGLQR